MTTKNKAIAVKLLGKEYQVTCPTGEEYKLMDAANLLDQKMSDIRKNGRVIGLERITMMAALNLAHELLSQQATNSQTFEVIQQKIETLTDKLSSSIPERKYHPKKVEQQIIE